MKNSSAHVLAKHIKTKISKNITRRKNNKYVLSRFIDVTYYLAKQEHSFREYDVIFQVTFVNSGSYLELIHLMGTLFLVFWTLWRHLK